MTPEQLRVGNDETDFYGKQYWLNHQSSDLGFPDIYKRARNDLTERNLHWLKTLLKYRLPSAKVLELGCSHGSFVALMRQAGYDAAGVEMSPWVVEFGQKIFGVPISVGPIENLDIVPGSLDVIALMDVLEHLPDPVATMAHCLQLLKPDGILLIQTPQFKEEMDYTALVETKGAFLEQLKADEHLYLFSDRSVTRLFQQLGAEYIEFVPAIFGIYDMFFAVSRAQLQVNIPEQVDSALLSTSNGRLALALLDLRERELDLMRKLQESESDRAARWTQIETLTAMLKESESDRAARGEQIETLTRMLRGSKANRVGLGEQIESLAGMLKKSDSDRAALGVQIDSLTAMLTELDFDRAARGEQIESLSGMLKEFKADSAARGEQIEMLVVDLRALFARPGFRWLIRFSSWPEVRKLAERVGAHNE
ncbi:MAG: methyltransferase domain-containing protein [Thiobacillus sp.]|nr:methyltransferase domain-containing protein [Thiobacillus sp.]MDP2979197.1 methyltransferase domain-containing protein [Thiobacillus sp.]